MTDELAAVEPVRKASAAATITGGSSGNEAACGSNVPSESPTTVATTTAEPNPEQEAEVAPPSAALDASEAGTSTSPSGGGGDAAGWKVGPEDFTLLCVIGQGAFGRVLQVRSKFDGEVYAMKVISKRMLKKKNHLSYMRCVRHALALVDTTQPDPTDQKDSINPRTYTPTVL